MTAREFHDRTMARITVMQALEARAKRAAALGIRLRGLVLTEAEAAALTVERGGRCWIDGRLMPVHRIIAARSDATT
jgi:hypothetical protein